jgi:hypothetical protein
MGTTDWLWMMTMKPDLYLLSKKVLSDLFELDFSKQDFYVYCCWRVRDPVFIKIVNFYKLWNLKESPILPVYSSRRSPFRQPGFVTLFIALDT